LSVINNLRRRSARQTTPIHILRIRLELILGKILSKQVQAARLCKCMGTWSEQLSREAGNRHTQFDHSLVQRREVAKPARPRALLHCVLGLLAEGAIIDRVVAE
jgi:hypothetical protein